MDKANRKAHPADREWRGSHFHSRNLRGKEEVLKRSRNAKLFKLGRNTRQFVVYPEAVHFKDKANKWQEIDNSLVRRTNADDVPVYANEANALRVEFACKSDTSPLISMKDAENRELGWDLVGANTDIEAILEPKKNLCVADEDDRRASLENIESALMYNDILPNVDLICRLQGTHFKDDIVLKNDMAQRVFEFVLHCDGVRLAMQENGDIIAHSMLVPEKKVFILPAAFMRDAEGKIGQVKTELHSDGADYRMILTCDEEFLKTAAFPVVVDPFVKTEEHSSTMEDNWVTTLSPDTVQSYSSGRLRICKNNSHGECRSFLKWTELPDLFASDVITKAYLRMSLYSDMGTQAVPIHLKEVTESWSSRTITWNNQPETAEYDSDCVIVPANAGTGSSFAFDISNLVRKWYTGSNNGVMFERRITTTPNTVEFVSSDSVYNKPVVMINYISCAGLEDYMTFDTIECGRAGTGHVNLFNGNLVVERPLTSCGGNRMPVSVTMYYGTNLYSSGGDLGRNWRLNYDQTIIAETIDETKYYKYTQGDGTEHYFALENGNTYKDMSGLSLTMTVDSEEILIESKDGMQWHFEPDPNDLESFSHLLSINDSCGNTITLTYANTGNHVLQRITDGAGRVTTFTYTDDVITSILAPGETNPVTLEYYDNRLSCITDGDGVQTTLYWESYLNEYGLLDDYLGSIGGADGRHLSISYPYTNPKRVESMGILYPDGESLYSGTYHRYEYKDCQTVVIDATVENGKRLLYQFNDFGNLVCVRDELGYASYQKFSEELLPNHPEQTSKLQRSVMNMLPNHTFESTDNWYVSYRGDAEGTAMFAYGHPYMGARAMRISHTNDVGEMAAYTKCEQLVIGKKYTFSAYIYTEDEYRGRLTIYHNNKWIYGPYIVPREWTRVHMTFTAEATSANLFIRAIGHNGATGYLWVDAVQLEEGCVVNRYNLLENCDFTFNAEGSPNHWLANGDNTLDDTVVASTDTLHPTFLSSNVMRIYGDPQAYKGIYQDIPLSGSEGDVYVVGGWAKGYSCPIGDNPRHFGIRVAFKNSAGTRVNTDVLNWNEEWTEWQYISGAVIAPCDYTEIRFNVDYEKNLNFADFDGFTLYKEEFGNTFAYDEDGNVTAVKNLASKQARAEYDDYNNLISYVQPGRAENIKTTINYGSTDAEKKRRLPLYTESPSNIRNGNGYDDHGNVVRSFTIDVMDGTQVIESYQSHTSDGNHVATKTDSRGEVVTYTHNLAKDTLTKVTDPKGQSIEYTYDNRKRVTAATANVDGSVYKNTYSYENDRLKTAAHNTTNATPDVIYTFEYDKFGKPTSVCVGDQILSTNIYTETGDRTLTDVEYANGGRVHYIYDDFRRVTGLQYDAATTPRFTYDYGANGQIAYVRDNELNRTIWTEYDTSERPICTHVLENETTSSPGSIAYVSRLAYDEYGNVEELIEEINDESSYETYFTYDNENRPTEIQFGDPDRILTYTYDRIGRISERRANGWGTAYSTTYTYLEPENSDGILTTPLVASITQSGQNFTYTYDNVGNIVSVTRNGLTTTYEYDKLGQLTRVNDPHANKTTIYEYDLGGNIQSYSEYAYTTGTLGNATATVDYRYSVSSWKDKVTFIDGKPITYDALGNPLTYDGWTYSWRCGRMLRSMRNADTTAQFAYDHNGLRIKKVVNDVTTQYVLNGKDIVHMACGNHELHFYYDAQGKPAMIRYNGESDYYFVYNLQGDVVALVDDAGIQVVEYHYDAWGALVSKTGSLVNTIGTLNPFRYRGYVYDEETELYYLNNRYYNPKWKRFISSDSTDVIEVSLTPLVSSNLYAYCSNNPQKHKDEDGNLGFLAIGISILTGLAAQYTADVVSNYLNGKRGVKALNVFENNNLAEYVAVGVTAVIPGSGLCSSVIKNTVSEGIKVTAKILKGEEVDLNTALREVGKNTLADGFFGYINKSVVKKIASKAPQNYSSFASTLYKKNNDLTMPQIKQRMIHAYQINRGISEFASFSISVVQNLAVR